MRDRNEPGAMPLPDDPRYEPTKRLYEFIVRMRAIFAPVMAAVGVWIVVADGAPWPSGSR